VELHGLECRVPVGTLSHHAKPVSRFTNSRNSFTDKGEFFGKND
jgi:hypothetical protein